jgi:acetyltransferase-like isoleucine patch superfamily enzyme
MKIKAILNQLYTFYCIVLCRIFYPKCPWLIHWNPRAIFGYILPQRILNINKARNISWPVHFTSNVSGKIKVGTMTSPGMSPVVYVNAMAGIEFGDIVFIGPGAKIISANHDPDNLEKHLPAHSMRIGSNVWIGANAVILPGVDIGDGVIVGAGAVVTRPVPAGNVVAGNPARIIKEAISTTR